jgi:tetraacyldisaccharide 4'-kinase
LTSTSDYFRALTSGQQRGFVAGLQRLALHLLSVPYGLAVRVRNGLFDRGWKRTTRVAVPVISVGNLTLGGTGKTPCVEYLAEFFRRREVRVAILSRGYGSTSGRNDEALVLEENLPDVPHLQGPDRVELAQTAIEELESELLILDDGFQHRRLQRDLDLVLIDCTNPWGHDYLFPRGWLREPKSSLRRAGAVLLTRCDQVDVAARERIKETVRRFNPQAPVVETAHRPVSLVNSRQEIAPLERLRGQPIAAFCGLGNPEAFRQTLVALGANVVDFRSYPDHHGYTREDVEELRRWARKQTVDCVMVTTQKDLVKLRLDRLDAKELWAVRIRLQVESGAEMLEQKLADVMPTMM